MEKKRIAFVDMPAKRVQSYFLKVLKRLCDVEIVDKMVADYVFYSVFGDDHLFANDHSIKIFYTGENRTPDFNECDYAIGFDHIYYGDRYLRYPLYYLYEDMMLLAEKKHLDIDEKHLLSEKTDFCSVTVSNTNRPPNFFQMAEALEAYKPLDYGGSWKNNVGGNVQDKLAFDRTHKFTMAFEHTGYSGYITEKIVEAFAARTIPIFWGDPAVVEVFNPRAFINVHNYSGVSAVVDVVRKLDEDKELYLAMQREPMYVRQGYALENAEKQLEGFLSHILFQPTSRAIRRTPFAMVTQPERRTMQRAYWKSKRPFFPIWVASRIKSKVLDKWKQRSRN